MSTLNEQKVNHNNEKNNNHLDSWISRCSNKNISNQNLYRLVSDALNTKDYVVISYVCAWAASCKNISLSLLKDLYEIDNPIILAAVLDNPKTPTEWIKKKVNYQSNSNYKVNLNDIL